MTTPAPSAAAPAGTGLTSAEADRRLAEHGPNAIAEPRPRRLPGRVFQQLRDPMIVLLLAAGAITAVMRDFSDMLVIGVVVVVNTTVGVVQEVRADRAISALRRLSAPSARVLRDGRTAIVPAALVVPGDQVLVEAGDVVPADIELATAVHLQADESALTGESLPVDKSVGAGETGMLRAGTVVTRGRGEGAVTATGKDSALGQIAALLAEQPVRPTPLQRRLGRLARVLTVSVLVIGAVVVVLGLLRGQSLEEMVVVAISLAVAAVPESMPAVVTLALAIGAHRMARRSAVVRSLPAVETLGSVTVIASDKTGTLTEGRMRAEIVWTPEGRYVASGQGYAPHGSLAKDGVPVSEPPAGLRRLLRDVALCNDADLLPPGNGVPQWRPVGDPQEAALVALAGRGGVDVMRLRAVLPRCAEVPFDSSRARMTTVHELDDRRRLVVCKGAPERLFDTPDLLADPAGEIAEVAAAAGELASEGYRVLAVADAVTAGTPPEPERGLRLVGLVGVVDPLRPEAEHVADVFDGAGVRFVLITGDHPATAAVIARRLDIGDGQVVLGDAVTGKATDKDLLDRADVFARTRPEQKLALIRTWQDHGQVVAMTGDGVNDAPALRRADIGVAMGAGGTEVARQAADLVLVDDNLGTVAVAIKEGRRIYANVRRFLGYALSGGLAEVLVMLIGPFLGQPIPLLPGQILWVNMLTHGLPGVAMGAEPAEPGALRRRPLSPRESVLGAGLWRQIVFGGGLITAVVLVAAQWAAARGGHWQSTAFVVLGLAQLGIALALRSRGRGMGPTRFLFVAVAGAALLQVAPLYVPGLQELLRLVPLSAADLGMAVAFATFPGLVMALVFGRRSASARGTAEGTVAS
ncbi:cation-translocating P-type ATPase [Actinopolymorpha alba]|uniref:cation-translocating P-type ATPase n=1 Tax=Actinopolymorpha alba TaxID=533267 RepID=UPI0003751BE6|nr:cation-transporting P-type ATPase [Actinopolymorpha alba]